MEPAPAKAKPQGRLLVSTQLDAKDELEEVVWPGSALQREPGPGPGDGDGDGDGARSRVGRRREHFGDGIQRDTMEP